MPPRVLGTQTRMELRNSSEKTRRPTTSDHVRRRVYWFNPFAEGFIAYGKSYTPRKSQILLCRDLENLPQFLCAPGDLVLVRKQPSAKFLNTIQSAGFCLPEFVELSEKDSLHRRELGALCPWAWGPDSLALFRDLSVLADDRLRPYEECFNEKIAELYSKAWSASLLRRALAQTGRESWLCTADEIGVVVDNPGAAIEAIRAIRVRGQRKVVVKEAVGLAGHNSLRLWEPEILADQSKWIEQVTAGRRQVIVEPWLDRELDFSIQLEMGNEGLNVCGYTGLINDRRGQFRANWAAPDFARHVPSAVSSVFPQIPELRAALGGFYESVFGFMSDELRQVGYEGPLGIDAFVYRGEDGRHRIKPIVEINARFTMGRVTVELMRHVVAERYGIFHLLTLPMLRANGFDSFVSYARHLGTSASIHLDGFPVPKIGSGVLCLTDPERAQVCLAVFEIAGQPPPNFLGDSIPGT